MNKIKDLFKKKEQENKANAFEKVSYSQCGEDILIDFVFKQLKIENPSYLDIGAHHPFHLNNTYYFYKNGSSGVNI
jgi:hypothetical protein